jgi:inorganic pyrophosphatase
MLKVSAANLFPPPLYITERSTKRILSAWHDIPLHPRGDPSICNFIAEIPKGIKPPKLEVDVTIPYNAILQDKAKDGSPRHYKLDTLIHYGALPQTYENPEHKDSKTNQFGDGDPIDVCEIATHRHTYPGAIYRVKVLGVLAMIDGGETDWKVLAVRTDDPLAKQVEDISKISSTPIHILKLADQIREWFRIYKVPEGKGENSFSFNGQWLGRDDALDVISDTHQQWKDVVEGKVIVNSIKKKPWLPSSDWKKPDIDFLQPVHINGDKEGISSTSDLLTSVSTRR